MLWALAAAGMKVAGAYFDYKADKAEAKAAQAFQRYRNKMTQLSNSLAQNAITSNELITNEQSRREALQIQEDYNSARGETQVQAGATYTAGRSVNRSLTILDITKSMAENVRQENLINAWQGYDAQRKNAAMSAAMQQDHSYIPTPKLGAYLFKAASGIAGSDSAQSGRLGTEASAFASYFL